jgi:hypothetical protein
MNLAKLQVAIQASNLFFALAQHARASAVRRKTEETLDVDYSLDFYFSGYSETAAARRASMDLTRALAELRKP